VIAGTLTLVDATTLPDGQYRWSDLPFGTYLLNMTRLPAGYTTYYIPRAPGVEGAPVSGYSISLDEASGPALSLRIYLISGSCPDRAPWGSRYVAPPLLGNRHRPGGPRNSLHPTVTTFDRSPNSTANLVFGPSLAAWLTDWLR